MGIIQAWLENTPKALMAASCKAGDDTSLIRTGKRGMKIFCTIGSIPICLLKADFPRRAMSFTRSVSRSGRVLARSVPLLSRFLSMVISRVGRELLFVMS